MNLFRLAGDLTHLASFVVLLLKILATRSCRGKKRACVVEGGSSSRSFYEGTGSQKKTSFFQSRRSMARTDSGACSPIPLSFSLSLSSPTHSRNRHLPPNAGALHARLRVPLPGPVYSVRDRDRWDKEETEKGRKKGCHSMLSFLRLLRPPPPPPPPPPAATPSPSSVPPRTHPPPNKKQIKTTTATSPSTTP